jgi:hypothetical protein
MEEEHARVMDPATVEEAISKVPAWTWQQSGRRSARFGVEPTTVEAVEERARGWQRNDTASVRI